MPSRSMIEAALAHLTQRRRELHGLVQATIAHSDEEGADHQAELIASSTEQWESRVLSQLGEVEARELRAVIAALARITEGTYGTCANCEEPIGVARLEALPEAAWCITCASVAERRAAQAAGRPRS